MRPFEVFDSHVHYDSPAALDGMRAYCAAADLAGVCLASISYRRENPHDAAQNLMALLFKREEPSYYAFGSLMYPEAPVVLPVDPAWDFRAQAQRLWALGFDGIKLLETKPGYRKWLGVPLSDPAYEPFFTYLEAEGIPVLWHVADPETFWDQDKAPAFAVKAGWVYTDGTFPTKRSLYDETEAVLSRHPNLKVMLAHFYFLSAYPDAAGALLEQYPNVWLDITPGIEMYENFSLRPAVWHDFFLRYQDRIVLGTDFMEEAPNGPETVEGIVRFLSDSEAFSFWNYQVQGIGLTEEAVSKICAANFRRRVGTSPRPVDGAALGAFIDEMGPLCGDASLPRQPRIDSQGS